MTGPTIRLRRLIALRDHGFPLAEQKEREGALDFNIFMDICGTEGCLLGWWATTKYARGDGWTMSPNTPRWNGMEGGRAADNYFGDDAYYNLFMPKYNEEQSNADCLAERRDALDEMIAEARRQEEQP